MNGRLPRPPGCPEAATTRPRWHAEAGPALWNGSTGGDQADPLKALRTERIATHRSPRRARALAHARLGRRAEAVELARARPRRLKPPRCTVLRCP